MRPPQKSMNWILIIGITYFLKNYGIFKICEYDKKNFLEKFFK